MLSNLAILALSALVPAVVAQQSLLPNLPFNMSYTPDLSTTKIPLSRRGEWCRGERNVCDMLCGSPSSFPKTNDCSVDTLDFSCLCQNGTAPGLQYYRDSMPSFICEETFAQCNAAKAGDSTGQRGCESGVKSLCGTLDASKISTGGGSGGGSSTGGGGAATTPTPTGGSGSNLGTPQGTAASSTTKPGSASAQVPQLMGMAAAAAVLGVFAL